MTSHVAASSLDEILVRCFEQAAAAGDDEADLGPKTQEEWEDAIEGMRSFRVALRRENLVVVNRSLSRAMTMAALKILTQAEELNERVITEAITAALDASQGNGMS